MLDRAGGFYSERVEFPALLHYSASHAVEKSIRLIDAASIVGRCSDSSARPGRLG